MLLDAATLGLLASGTTEHGQFAMAYAADGRMLATVDDSGFPHRLGTESFWSA